MKISRASSRGMRAAYVAKIAPWFTHQPVLASALPSSSITWMYVGRSISPPPTAAGIARWNRPASASPSKTGRVSWRLASISSAAARICGASLRAASSGEGAERAVMGLWRSSGPLRDLSRRRPRAGGRRAGNRLLDDRARGGHDALHLDLLAVDQRADLGRDLVLPVIALVDEVVEALALALVLEAANPDVDTRILLAHEAAEDDHAHLDLERDDLLLHALHPLGLLAGTDDVLP